MAAQTPRELLESVPALKPVLLLIGLALAVALGISLFMWSRGPDWAPLTGPLDERAAAAAIQNLEARGIPTRRGPEPGVVTVPRTQLHAARLALAGNEATSGGVGFDMLSETPGFGVSQFMESARYQYALETELARTIGSLSPVRAARVHLAVARDSAFVRDRRQASASVVVDLHAGRSLDRGQAQAIVNLVAASVPDMAPENVTVVDSAGKLLSQRAGEGDDGAAQAFEMARRTEAVLTSRIVSLLEPMVGSGRVRAQVTVEHHQTETEEARERVLSDPQALRSERLREERGDRSRAEGAAGAAANMPDNPDADAGGAEEQQAVESRDVSREFALGRELSYSRQPAGRLRRISAAVLVDHIDDVGPEGEALQRPLSDEELARVERLVASAIGIDPERGDRLSVDNSRFIGSPLPPPPEAPTLVDQVLSGGWLQMIARNLGGVIVLLVLIFAVLRPTLRALLQPITVSTADSVDNAGLIAASGEAGAAGAIAGGRHPEEEVQINEAPYSKKLEAARAVVQQDPKRVAQLMRSWVGNDG